MRDTSILLAMSFLLLAIVITMIVIAELSQ
jgi:hypothetical protein